MIKSLRAHCRVVVKIFQAFSQESACDSLSWPNYDAGKQSSSSTGAIAGGVAAGAALIFAVPAIGFAWWRRRRPQEHFFDVPGTKHPPQWCMVYRYHTYLIILYFLNNLRKRSRNILNINEDGDKFILHCISQSVTFPALYSHEEYGTSR